MRNHENHEKHEPMVRVNKERPCPMCGKHDWCLVSADGSAAICARIKDGSVKRCGDAGWLHLLAERAVLRPQSLDFRKFNNHPLPPSGYSPLTVGEHKIDFIKLAEEYRRRCSERQVRFLATSLGITTGSLVRLGVGWDGEAFCFPMRDENGIIVGIRRRFGNGRKVCVTGSQNGLFIPSGVEKAVKLVITEGPTDCAAALDLGWNAIGRPNCDSKIPMTIRYVRRRAAIIVADRDSAGLRGAQKLFEALDASGSAVRIIVPPDGCKDLRQWKQTGGRIAL